MTLFSQLKTDARALAMAAYKSTAPQAVARAVLATDSFRITALQRLRESARRHGVIGVNHALRVVQTAMFGIEIGKDVSLGEGVYFLHPLGTVIGGNSRIGDGVRFMGNNTVGTAKDNGYPTIERHVLLGAGARILGPITVGEGAVIGANAVVLVDVPKGAVAVGVPAKVICAKKMKSPRR